MLRMTDYAVNCITKLFNTGQANADIIEEDLEESDDQGASMAMSQSVAESEMESLCIESMDDSNV